MSSPASEAPGHRFHSEATDELEQPTTSPWAVGTCLLGILSVAALASPVLWMLPIITLLVGGFTLRTLAVRRPAARGRKLVLIGLTLACFLGGFAPVRHFHRQHVLFAQARLCAEHWFDLIRQGRTMDAHRLQLGYAERSDSSSPLGGPSAGEMRRAQFDAFVKNSPVKELARWGLEGQVAFRGDLRIDSYDTSDLITQRFEVSKEGDPEHRRIVVDVALIRQVFPAQAESHWQVRDCKIISIPPNLP